MRIAQVTPYFNFPGRGPVGGVLLYVYELSRVLARRGHEVTVYTSGDSLRGSMLRVPREALEHEEGITVRR
ncbi:glycosyltransferase, partial [Candidatus Bathyarchaeota archaeon]|nr:glycosyltransferase [Candidatus Bathyarchaeota archaeon]